MDAPSGVVDEAALPVTGRCRSRYGVGGIASPIEAWRGKLLSKRRGVLPRERAREAERGETGYEHLSSV